MSRTPSKIPHFKEPVMPLKRKRKTETDTETGAGAGSEKTEVLTVPVAGDGESRGPSAWNLDAFTPYQPEGVAMPSFSDDLPTDSGEKTDAYPSGLLNGLHGAADESDRTDVLDLDQSSQKTQAFESISQFDKTLHLEHPAQFETTKAYDVSSGNGLTPRFEAEPAPELEPVPSIFASFQEQKASATPLFDDSISPQDAPVPSFDTALSSFDALPVAPPAPVSPAFEREEPVAPVFDPPLEPLLFDSAPEPLGINTTQRFTSDDLGIAPPLDLGTATTTAPSYTGAQTFDRPAYAEPEVVTPSQPMAASGRLIVRLGRFSASYEVDRPEILIGRPDPESEIFPEVSIEWDDAISRRHARILHRDDGDFLEDTGSTNGTKLNGIPLTAYDPQQLFSGDLIHVGSKTEIIYYA